MRKVIPIIVITLVFVSLLVVNNLQQTPNNNQAEDITLKLEKNSEEPESNETTSKESNTPPAEIPKGILVDVIPEKADILFVSIRYVLNDLDCLDDNYEIKKAFLSDSDCIKKIYNSESNVLASPRQLYTLDIDTGDVTQLTNINYDFSSSKPIDSTKIMAIGAGSDTDGDGVPSTKDEINIFLLDLTEKKIENLTSGLNLTSINNPDYSTVTKKIVFSAQRNGVFHNYLFTLDLNKTLTQITNDEEYHDFDCSWSEDGLKIVFSRLPDQDYPWVIPSQVWLMDSDGKNKEKITDGGVNPDNEEPHGPYPIGIDADPDLSPDNKQIVFSRLRTGKQNEPFGVYELVIYDIETNEEIILDSSYANMIPEWKTRGILFIRQIGSSTSAMNRKQSMYIYKNDEFTSLEIDPFSVFPIGSNGASWIEYKSSKIQPLPTSADILFTSNQDTGERREEIYSMNSDGGDITRITFTDFHHFIIGIDNSDRYLIVTRAVSDTVLPEGLGDEDKKSLWVIDLETGKETRLTREQDQAEGDSFSPDSEWIVFWMQPEGQETSDIYKIRKNGSNLTQLTNTPYENEFDPQWSNTGNKIAYISINSNKPRCILNLMNSNGTNSKIIYDGEDTVSTSNFPPGVFDPSWSPDDQWIVFEKPTLYSGENGGAGIWHLFKIKQDGTGLIDLSETGNHAEWAEYLPSFSLDGESIIFTARYGSSDLSNINIDIYRIDKDGGSLEKLTDSLAYNGEAIWIKNRSLIR